MSSSYYTRFLIHKYINSILTFRRHRYCKVHRPPCSFSGSSTYTFKCEWSGHESSNEDIIIYFRGRKLSVGRSTCSCPTFNPTVRWARHVYSSSPRLASTSFELPCHMFVELIRGDDFLQLKLWERVRMPIEGNKSPYSGTGNRKKFRIFHELY